MHTLRNVADGTALLAALEAAKAAKAPEAVKVRGRRGRGKDCLQDEVRHPPSYMHT